MSGSISQIQMLYNPEEDRVLFRVNTSDSKEYRLWITRRYAILMLKILREHTDSDPDISTQEDPVSKEAVKTFKQEQAIQSANFEQKFQEANELPLGDQVPVAYKLTYRIEGENLHLTIEPKTGPGINIAISHQINATLVRLIVNAAKQAEWRLDDWLDGREQVPDKVVIN